MVERLVFGGAFALVGAFAVVSGLRQSMLGIHLLRVARTDIGTVHSNTGQVCVQGAVQADDGTQVAPLSGEPAVVAVCTVERLETDTSGETHTEEWERVEETNYRTSFEITDGTGMLRVDPAKAELDLGVDDTIIQEPGDELPESVRSHIEASSLSFDVEADTFKHRYTEKRLEPESEALVVGEISGQKNATIDGGNPFLISDSSKSATARSNLLESFVPLVFGAIAFIAGVAVIVL